MGIIVFAFGMGGPVANFAGLLHMTMHSLTKSAIFFTVGPIVQAKGTQKLSGLGGLTVSQPILGWSLVIGVVAIAGLPPFGAFMSEFLVVTSTFAQNPWLALVFSIGLLVAFAALALHLHHLAFGEPQGGEAPAMIPFVPLAAHLAPVLIAGLYLPPALVACFQQIADFLG